MLKKIWPWSKFYRDQKTIDAIGRAFDQTIIERDDARARSIQLEERIKELRSQDAQIAKLKRQIEDYTRKAKTDVRSGYIMHDKQQATDIKFRSVKTDLQVMKKVCKQASVAIRYAAQQIKSNAIQSDLRRIAEIIHPDHLNTMGIEYMRSADMVEDTITMSELVKLSNGRKEN